MKPCPRAPEYDIPPDEPCRISDGDWIKINRRMDVNVAEIRNVEEKICLHRLCGAVKKRAFRQGGYLHLSRGRTTNVGTDVNSVRIDSERVIIDPAGAAHRDQ